MTLMESESVYLKDDGQSAIILINRPESLNALNPDVLQSLILVLEKVEKNPAYRVVILSGAGEKAFVAGADIKSMASLGPRAIADYIELGQRAMRALETLRIPVIAAVDGYALGGGLELALACDLIIASRASKLGQPEVTLGIIPGFGGTQRLIQRCGIGTARRLTYTGEIISADEALRLGIVDQVFEHADLWKEVTKIAETIASRAPLAVEEGKRVLRESQDPSLIYGLRREVNGFLTLFDTKDRSEGMEAFLQKREAKFTRK